MELCKWLLTGCPISRTGRESWKILLRKLHQQTSNQTVERFVYQYSSDEDQNLIASPDTLTETTANTNAPGVIIQPDDVSLPDNRNIGDSLEVALETKLHPEEPKVTTDYEAEVHLESKPLC